MNQKVMENGYSVFKRSVILTTRVVKVFKILLLASYVSFCQSQPKTQNQTINKLEAENVDELWQKLRQWSLKQPSIPWNYKIHKIAFGSCMDQRFPAPIWSAIDQWQPDIFITLGDTVYAAAGETQPIVKAYVMQLEEHPELQRFYSKVPFIGIWDDHDFGINDGSGYHEKYSEAREALLTFLPNTRKIIPENQEGLYYSLWLGMKPQTVQIIVLDLRTFKSPWKLGWTDPDGRPRWSVDDSSDKTLLGPQQWEWLEKELQKPATVRFLISSIQLIPNEHNFERWGLFPKERERFLNLIEKKKIKNLFILSGDRHLSEVSVLKLTNKIRLVEFTSSSLNRPAKRFDPNEPNSYRLKGSFFPKANFGTITIDYAKKQITYQTRDESGHIVFEKTFNYWN